MHIKVRVSESTRHDAQQYMVTLLMLWHNGTVQICILLLAQLFVLSTSFISENYILVKSDINWTRMEWEVCAGITKENAAVAYEQCSLNCQHVIQRVTSPEWMRSHAYNDHDVAASRANDASDHSSHPAPGCGSCVSEKPSQHHSGNHHSKFPHSTSETWRKHWDRIGFGI